MYECFCFILSFVSIYDDDGERQTGKEKKLSSEEQNKPVHAF